MGHRRLANAETYGLAALGLAKGVIELMRDEVKEFTRNRREAFAPSIGHTAVMERADELQKAA